MLVSVKWYPGVKVSLPAIWAKLRFYCLEKKYSDCYASQIPTHLPEWRPQNLKFWPQLRLTVPRGIFSLLGGFFLTFAFSSGTFSGTCTLLLFSKLKAQDLIKSKSLTYMFLIIIETCCLFHKGDSLPTQVWTSSYLTCWRPHHKVAGWCQEMDLVWMTCSGSEEWSLSFSWGVPADTCHQVHRANEIWGAASSPTLPPRLRACLLGKCSSLLILENWGIHNTLQIILPPGWSLAMRQTVDSVTRMFLQHQCIWI